MYSKYDRATLPFEEMTKKIIEHLTNIREAEHRNMTKKYLSLFNKLKSLTDEKEIAKIIFNTDEPTDEEYRVIKALKKIRNAVEHGILNEESYRLRDIQEEAQAMDLEDQLSAGDQNSMLAERTKKIPDIKKQIEVLEKRIVEGDKIFSGEANALLIKAELQRNQEDDSEVSRYLDDIESLRILKDRLKNAIELLEELYVRHHQALAQHQQKFAYRNTNYGTYLNLHKAEVETAHGKLKPEAEILTKIVNKAQEFYSGNLMDFINKHGELSLHNPVVYVLINMFNTLRINEIANKSQEEKMYFFDMETSEDAYGKDTPYMMALLTYAVKNNKPTIDFNITYINTTTFFEDQETGLLLQKFYKLQEDVAIDHVTKSVLKDAPKKE